MENVIYISERCLLCRMLECNIKRISVRLILFYVRGTCYLLKAKLFLP